MDVLVQELLPLGEHASADVLRSEVGRQGINHDEPNRKVLRELLRLLNEQHLMMAVERAGDVDPFEDRLRVQVQRIGHLSDSLGSEGLLRVDPHDVSVQPPVILRPGHVDRELVADL